MESKSKGKSKGKGASSGSGTGTPGKGMGGKVGRGDSLGGIPEISDQTVEIAWQEVGGLGDGARVKLMLEELERTQPAVADFIGEVARKIKPEAADLGYFVALVVWRSYVKEIGFPIEPLSDDEVIGEYERTEAWLEKMSALDEIILAKKLRDPKEYAQPQVMAFVLEAIFEAHEDGLEIDPEDQERLFIAMKVVSDSFNRARPLAN